MIATWYALVSFLLIGYVVLDGRNFGAGMIHWLVARTPMERREVLAAIGPYFHFHEVWLISFGGSLLAIFPRLMAVSFAGYYLALFLILWCLLLRSMAIEVRGHINDRLWQQFWDFVFVVASVLLAVLFGAAAGNVARGVPIDQQGNFSIPFFTNFNVRGNVGILDWYTVSIAVFAVIILAAHGATYLTLKTSGPVRDRSLAYSKWLWLATIPVLVIITIETLVVRSSLFGQGLSNPLCWLGGIVILASVGGLVSGIRQGREFRAFLGSSGLIIGMLATGGAVIYPVMLFSTLAPEDSLRAEQVASNSGTLAAAIVWWLLALCLTAGYVVFISRQYHGKVSIQRDDQGYD